MRAGIIICTRTDSTRIPNKPLVKANGVPLIEHLVKRLLAVDLPIIIAAPMNQVASYFFLETIHPDIAFWPGSADDPLNRMAAAAEAFELDVVIRVTHDKVFVDPELIWKALDEFHRRNLDYLYSSQFPDGTAFEIISNVALQKAAASFEGVEHISYAIRAITDNKLDWTLPEGIPSKTPRLLIDYPKDLQVLEAGLVECGNNCTYSEIVEYIKSEPMLWLYNKLPMVTVYTCARNAGDWLIEAMNSVLDQSLFNMGLVEYILIDDFSDDHTFNHMVRYASSNPKISVIRNQENLGLASSSNIALRHATGKYIVRLDADDYFSSNCSLVDLVNEIDIQNKDVIYPNNYFGSMEVIQNGKDCHHIGGALFRRRAINHVRFTDGLRGYDGLDFWSRAKAQLEIGYLNKPVFFYRQHDGSMSKTNLEKRKKIRKSIEKKNGL